MEINKNKSSNFTNFGQYGWVCPLCGRIWSPYVRECTCNRFYDSNHITCQAENKNVSKSIFEGQNSHIPQIDSNFIEDSPKNDIKISSHLLGGETLDVIAIFSQKCMLEDKTYVQSILNDMENPFINCKQVESGGYLVSGPVKNNIIPIDINKKKGNKK